MKKRKGLQLQLHWRKHLMLLPGIVLIFIFSYIPMVGIVMAFQDYDPTLGYFGSEWVKWENFEVLFALPDMGSVILNTLRISVVKLVTVLIFSVVFALFLNEVRSKNLRMLIQSLVLFPFFISWVVLASIIKDLASSEGIINQAVLTLTGQTIPFLTDSGWFEVLLVVTNIWKDFGYNAVIIMATLSSIDPALYEAATIDGAGRMQRMLHVSLPGIKGTILLLFILALGNVLSAGFDQVYNLYNTMVMDSADIIDTYVYRIGVLGGQYGLGTAVGLFKSVVGMILLISSYKAADKYAGYRIF